MDERANGLATVALDCLRDLGVTLVYATIAGGLIVAIVASDTGELSVLHAALYAAILPLVVLAMIGFEIVASLLAEGRARRRAAAPASRPRHEKPCPSDARVRNEFLLTLG